MGEDADGNQLTTTSTTTTTTTTTTITRSRQPSPNPESVSDSGYGSEHVPTASPSQPPPPGIHPPSQQRLPGPDVGAPPTAVHPAFRSQGGPLELRHLQTASDEYDRQNAPRAAGPSKDPLVTIRESRESRAMSENQSISSQQGRPEHAAPTSAFGNLKAATEGLGSVRDSVRSMVGAEQDRYYANKLSPEQDRHYGRKPSARDLKNQASAPSIRSRSQRPEWGASEPQSDASTYGSVQGSQPLNYSSSNSTMGQGSDGERRSRRKSLGQVPASFSPESTGTAPHEQMSSLRRLLKGKP